MQFSAIQHLSTPVWAQEQDSMTTNDLLGAGSNEEFDAGLIDTIDQSSLGDRGPSYPVIQWVLGDLKARKFGGMDYQGGFFVKASDVDADAMIAAGWEATTRTFRSGAEEEGFWKREASLCIIAQRKRWEVGEKETFQVFPWNAYAAAKTAASDGKKPHSKTHYLVLVKGLEHVGPFVVSMKGVAGAAFESRDANSVLTRFSATVIAAANAASDAAAKKAGKPGGKRWAYRAFRIDVGANRDAKGEPIYKKVGSGDNTINVVLPVALGLPDKPEGVNLNKFYVGPTVLAKANELFEQSADWRAAWDNITPSAADGNGDDTAAHIAAQTAVQEQEDAVLAAAGL
jgi:hypothetical protein